MSQTLFDLNFKKFQLYFRDHATQPWNRWLVDSSRIQQSSSHSERVNGKQGFVGVLQHPQNKNLTCLYKISKVDDNLVEHEYKIIKGLETLASYCPHFHRAFGIIPFNCNLHYNEEPLLYNKKTKVVQRNMLLMQHIQHKYNFREMIEDDNVKDYMVLNILKQIIVCIRLLHAYKFTHYDLHTENILIRNCHPNMFILYLIDDHTEILLPTFGVLPNIIDYGFAYCDVPDNDLTCTLVHTQYGFTSTRFDPFADIKLFLISTTDDMAREELRKEIVPKMRNILRNIFSGINVQWTCGWDVSKLISPVYLLQEMIKDYVADSVLFSKSDLWIDTIQELITLPLSPMAYHEMEAAFRGFISEFVKFEDRIISKTFLNYILKVFVRILKKYRTAYLSTEPNESEWAVLEVKKEFLEEYYRLVNYHIPQIDFEKMICSLLMISQCMEGFFFSTLEKRFEEKDRQYQLIRCQNILDFFYAIEYNFPPAKTKECYKLLNPKSSILVVDHVRKRNKLMYLNKETHLPIPKLSSTAETATYLRNLYEADHV